MIPTINGKPLLECSINDLTVILNNPDYQENEHIDYKQSFSILEIEKQEKEFKERGIAKDFSKKKQEAIEEFKSDVCSFANTGDGYLVFGIKEEKRVPQEICGFSMIDTNLEHFEQRIKNWLQSIKPRIPTYRIKALQLDIDRIVLIIFIKHDLFSPYLFLTENKYYRIYKRVHDSKEIVSYTELKNMFTQTIAFNKEIEGFRFRRTEEYYSLAENSDSPYSNFVLFHIIPETIFDDSYNQPIYVIGRKHYFFTNVFEKIHCYKAPFPTVEGIRYLSMNGNSEGHLYNNGIAEFFFSLKEYCGIDPNRPGIIAFPYEAMFRSIQGTIIEYFNTIVPYYPSGRFYVGISIIGCKGFIIEGKRMEKGIIDRDKLLMNTISFENNDDQDHLTCNINRLKIDYLLSLGLQDSDTESLIKKVYESESNEIEDNHEERI